MLRISSQTCLILLRSLHVRDTSLSRNLLRAWFSEVLTPYIIKIVGSQGIKIWIDSIESTGEIRKRVKVGKEAKSTEQALPYISQGPLR